jgi:hypothetical protein
MQPFQIMDLTKALVLRPCTYNLIALFKQVSIPSGHMTTNQKRKKLSATQIWASLLCALLIQFKSDKLFA